jgi:eukaryotic-like serine/threonine-protein kinase
MVAQSPYSLKCPSQDELKGLLQGDLPEPRQSLAQDHVGGCNHCQKLLDNLATGEKPHLSSLVLHIDRIQPKSDSAYWAALNRVGSALTEQFPPENTPTDLNLDFLQKSDIPGRIGRIGSFDVIKVIGRGGMGVVLQAFDRSLSREVAVKILDPQLASNTLARQRFCREARSAAAVSHDNVVAVHQVNEDEKSGLPYIVMQLVNGESLEQRLRRVGRLSVIDAVKMGIQAASGLTAAHSQGLIHRDIKPGNILIEKETEKVRLTDFGLARATEDLKLTRSGFVAGTPLYMAPEQARGDEIDPRADLFSLGIVLYEALAGKPPFDGRSPLAVLRRVADEAHAPLHRINPDVPQWLEDAIDQLLEKNPEDRFQSAVEVRDYFTHQLATIEPHTQSEAGAKCGSSASGKISRRRKMHVCWRTVGTMAATFLAGLVIGIVAFLEMTPDRTPSAGTISSPSPVPIQAAVVDEGPESKGVFAPRSGAIWAVALSPKGDRLAMGIESGKVSLWDVAKQSLLIELHPTNADQDPAHNGPVWAVDFTADGTKLLTASDDGSVKVWDSATGKMIRNIPTGVPVRSAAISSSGNLIAIGDRFGTVRIWSLADEKPTVSYEQKSTVNTVAFSADEMMVASAGSDGSVILWDMPLDRKKFNLSVHTSPVYGLGFSPDGDQLITASWDSSAVIWDLKTGSMKRKLMAHEEGVWGAQFAPCGKIVATSGQDGKARLWNAETGEQLASFGRHKGTIHAVRFTNDGKTLITAGRDGTVRLWDVSNCH